MIGKSLFLRDDVRHRDRARLFDQCFIALLLMNVNCDLLAFIFLFVELFLLEVGKGVVQNLMERAFLGVFELLLGRVTL